MRLYIHIFCSKKGFSTIYGELFHLIYYLASTIVALSGISFSILIGKYGASSFHYLRAYKIL